MSRLNQAFIKAYHKSAPPAPVRAEAKPASPAAPQVTVATTAQASTATVAITVDAPPHAAPQPAAAVMVVDTAHHEIKGPHARFGVPPASRSAGSSETTVAEAAPVATPGHGSGELTAPVSPGFAKVRALASPRGNPSGAPNEAATLVTSPPAAGTAVTATPSPPRPSFDAIKNSANAEITATRSSPSTEPRPIVLSISTAAQTWRPVFELSNFVWPDLTEAILASVPGQLSSAASELIEAARRHRKLVAIAAAQTGEGCTTVTLALARALVEQQQRVVVVDAHFAAPRLSECLGVTPQVGWEENLSGDKPLAEALIESLADHVTLLPLREPALPDWRPRDIRLKATFDELRRHYDLILIDAGPLGDAADRQHLLAWAGPCRVDRALVVLDTRVDNAAALNDVERRLQGCGIAQWNFVENFAAA